MPRAVWLTNIPVPLANHRYQLLADELHQRGIDFEVLFCAWSESDRHWRFDPADLQYPHRRLWGVQPEVGVRLHTNPGVVRAVRHPEPDLLVVAGYSAPTLLVAPYVAPRKAVRVLWSETQARSEERPSTASRVVKRRIFERFDAFAVPGETQAEFIHQVAPHTARRPVITIPHAVDETVFHDRVDELRVDPARVEATRQELGVEAETQLWVSVARLETRKGLHTLLPCLEGLERVHLVIAGSGSEHDALRRQADALDLPVTLLGHRDLDQMLDLYAAADLFTLPSLRDPSPVAAVEAAAAALPLLLSERAGNVAELVEPDVTGWVFRPDNHDEMRVLAKAIASLSRVELRAIGEATRARYRSRFDSARCIGEAADAFAHLIERGVRR